MSIDVKFLLQIRNEIATEDEEAGESLLELH